MPLDEQGDPKVEQPKQPSQMGEFQKKKDILTRLTGSNGTLHRLESLGPKN